MAFHPYFRWMEGTKEIFAEAFRRLKINNPNGRITVKRIAEEAGYDRHTFYYHFSSVDDLISWFIDDKLIKLFDDEDSAWEKVICSTLSLFSDEAWSGLATRINADTYALLIKKIEPVVAKDVRARDREGKLSGKDVSLIASSAVWAIAGFIRTWLSEERWMDEKEMAEKIIDLIRHYIDDGIAVFYQRI